MDPLKPRGEPANSDGLKYAWAILGITLLAGAAIRFVGIDWGLPVVLHPDENVIVRNAVDIANRGTLDPTFIGWPAHLLITLSSIAYTFFGWVDGGRSVAEIYASRSHELLLISRAITATFGTAMILLAYATGARFDKRVGIVAAILIAFFPPFVKYSYFATPDIPLTCALMAVTFACVRYIESGSYRHLLFACAATSIAVSIKWPGAIGAVMVGAVILIDAGRNRSWRSVFIRGGVSMVAGLGLFYLLSSSLVHRWPDVLENLRHAARNEHLGADGLGWGGNLAFYAMTFLNSGGVILSVLAGIGLYACAKQRLPKAVPVGLGLFYWLLLSSVALHWERWALPMYVTPLLLAAVGIVWLSSQRLANRSALFLRAALFLVMLNLLIGSLGTATRYTIPDTRIASRDDVAAKGINQSNTIYEGYTPIRPTFPKTIFGEIIVRPDRVVPREPGVRYIMLSSAMYDRFMANDRHRPQQRIYRIIDERYQLIETWEPIAPPTPSLFEPIAIGRSTKYIYQGLNGGFSGPTIKVYDMKADG